MRKIIFLWDDQRVNKINRLYYLKSISEIVLLGPVEATLSMFTEHDLIKLFQFSESNNIPLHIIISGYKDNPLHKNHLSVPDTVKIHCWEMYWLTETFLRMSNNEKISSKIVINNNKQKNFTHLLICLNKRPRNHRLILLDKLGKYNLIKTNLITWREWFHSFPSSYETKNWNQELLFLDQTDTTKNFMQEQLPEQYDSAFMQIVTETDENIFFLTEKTAVPIFFCKPFLVAGCKNFHKILQKHGFQLYDEIFDYSFDEIEDVEQRYEKLVQNAYRYKRYSPKDLELLYKKIEDKLLYNQKLALDIATDTSKFPKLWNTLAEQNDKEYTITNPYDINQIVNKRRIDLGLNI